MSYEAFVRSLAMNSDRKRTEAQQRAWWGQAEILADSRDKKRTLLNGISLVPQPFALEIASKFQADPDPNIRTMATAARAQIQQRIAARGKKTP